ncbi:MAG: hypothetical protein K6B74_06320 [Ruminococcus sp.]|nr:hypothetical protein [Ruminococcus sp.]
MFTYIVALLVIVDGVTRIIHEIMKVSQKKRRCTQAVTATCLDLRYIYGRHRRIMYYIHIWQYDFWGETIIVSDKIHDPSLEPNIGVSAEIMINPDDPRDIFRSVPKIADTQIGIGIVTAAMGLIMEVGFIYIHIMG